MHSNPSSIKGGVCLYIFLVLFCSSVFTQQSEEDVTENNGLINDVEENAQDNNGNPRVKHFLDLTPSEREVLDEFRLRVGPNLTAFYMESDEFLLRFLKPSKFNISSSTSLILDMLTWRKENNIDALSSEDYPEFEAEYVTYLEGCDRSGRPVISVPIGKWDIRSASLAGLGPRLRRFMDKIFEDATSFLRSVNDIGVELYQATLILDLDGFDMKTHGCPKCMDPICTVVLVFFHDVANSLSWICGADLFCEYPPNCPINLGRLQGSIHPRN